MDKDIGLRQFLLGFISFLAVISGAAWFTLQKSDIPHETLQSHYGFPASKYAELPSGFTLHYLDVGPRDADHTLILLHGFGLSVHSWTDLIQEMEKDLRIIAIDLPFHGLSSNANLSPISLNEHTDIVEELLGKLKPRGIVLAGAYSGAQTALDYSINYPGNVHGIVMISPSGMEEDDLRRLNAPTMQKLVSYKWLHPVLSGMDMNEQFRLTLGRYFFNKNLVTEEKVEQYASLARAPGHRSGMLKLMSETNHVFSEDELSGLQTPVYIIHGMEDGLMDTATSRRFAQSLPEATLSEFEACGLMAHVEMPKRTAAEILTFISSLDFVPDTHHQELESVGTVSTPLPAPQN